VRTIPCGGACLADEGERPGAPARRGRRDSRSGACRGSQPRAGRLAGRGGIRRRALLAPQKSGLCKHTQKERRGSSAAADYTRASVWRAKHKMSMISSGESRPSKLHGRHCGHAPLEAAWAPWWARVCCNPALCGASPRHVRMSSVAVSLISRGGVPRPPMYRSLSPCHAIMGAQSTARGRGRHAAAYCRLLLGRADVLHHRAAALERVRRLGEAFVLLLTRPAGH
jgi:hypothetical protein